MTHLPFIAASYALGVGIPAWLSVAAALRLGRARRRLAAVDPRQGAQRGRPRGVGPEGGMPHAPAGGVQHESGPA